MSANDEAQWIAWYQELEQPLYNVAYRWLWDAAESQDVVQEAFLRCWRMRQRVVAETFKPLIFQTTLRLLSNRARKRKLWRFVPLAETESNASSRTEEDILASRQVRVALDGIKGSMKQVLLLSEVGGLSYKEIAEVMQINEGTVGSRRHRALAALKERLEAQGVCWNET